MVHVNGSFVTSNLAIAQNVSSTDRILIVFNAISNSSVSNGSPSTRTITVNNFISSIVLVSNVGNLPAANAIGAGARNFVIDSNTSNFLDIVGGGGSNYVPVVSNGTSWLVG